MLEKIITETNPDSLKVGAGKINKIIEKIEIEGLETNNIKDAAITPEKTNFISAEPGKNLLNRDKNILNTIINIKDGKEQIREKWESSIFIKVNPSTTYTASGNHSNFARNFRFAEYDINKNFISGWYEEVTVAPSTTFTTSATTEYIRVCYASVMTNIMLNEGSTAEPYEAYKAVVSILGHKIQGTEITKPLQGKNIITFGDSITWYDGKPFNASHLDAGQTCKGYVSYLVDELGASLNNQGVSGWTAPQVLERVKMTDISAADYITVTSGANDWSQGVPIGEVQAPLGTYNETTYAGAMQSAIEYILANSNAKIILITPIKGYHPNHNPVEGVSVGDVEEQPYKFAEKIKELAKLYGLEVVDFRDKTGLNFTNYKKYLRDDPAQTRGKLVHPNNEFHKIMGKHLVNRMKEII